MTTVIQDKDILALLPRRPLSEFRPRAAVEVPGLALVIRGRIAVYRRELLEGIYGADEIIGEGCLIGEQIGHATALDNLAMMHWSAAEVLVQMERDSDLGVALMQLALRRNAKRLERLRATARSKIRESLIAALLHWADAHGSKTGSGEVTMQPLSHLMIAEYVGTSRSIITRQLGALQRNGLIRYSRDEMSVRVKALREELEKRNG